MVNAEKVKSIRAKAHANENMSGCSMAVLAALQEGLSIGDVHSL